MDNGRSTLVPLLQDPHLLEGGEVQSDSLLLHAVSNAGVLLNSVSRHGGVDVQAIPDVRKLGWNALGHLNLPLLMVMTWLLAACMTSPGRGSQWRWMSPAQDPG